MRRSEKGKGGRVRRNKLGAGLSWREGKGERERERESESCWLSPTST